MPGGVEGAQPRPLHRVEGVREAETDKTESVFKEGKLPKDSGIEKAVKNPKVQIAYHRYLQGRNPTIQG